MAYGIGKEYLRIPDSQFRYDKNGRYVYVDHGFFETRNFFRPLPLGFLFLCGHFLYAFGVYRVITQRLWISWIVNFWYGTWGGLSVTAGNHRLWCHRSFEAKLPLRIFLMLGQTMTGQYTVYSWAIGHRVHHKYSDTDADPHNTKRGFFFAHVGWLTRTEHPDVSLKERLYDYSDLDRDPVIVFQHKYYYHLYAVMTFILPMAVQVILAGDCLLDAFLLSVVMRNLSVYHDTAFVNSAAHMFGDRPYNKEIEPSENYFVSLASFGEGYHNYHHSFPWDYKAGEYAAGFNLTTLFLDSMYHLGQAYNMRTASDEVVKGSKMRTAAAALASDANDSKYAAGHDDLATAAGHDDDGDQVLLDQQLDQSRSIASWAKEVIKNRKLIDEDNTCEFL